MTAIFRSCLTPFESDISQNSMNCSFIRSARPKLQKLNLKKTRKRGPCYSRIDDKSQSLLTRWFYTIFGDQQLATNKKLRRKKTSHLPTQSTIKKQFNQNEQTLHSLVTLLTQIESSTKENEQNRNNNRIDEISTSSQSKRYTKKYLNLSRKKSMIDHQQQTQHIDSSTQISQTRTSESSWFDVIRNDQTTNNAWTRIKRRLKPNQQKDILRALMIICANLIDVPLEN